MNLDLARAQTFFYTAPLDDRDLLLARRRFVEGAGVDEDTVLAAVGVLMALPVWFDGNRFDLTEIRGVEPEVAIVAEALDADGAAPVDLIAWRPDRPTEIATCCGAAAMLGEADLWRPSLTALRPAPVRVSRTVGGWLQAVAHGKRAILPLDMRRTARVLLDVDDRLEFDSDAHGHEMRAAMASLVNVDRFVVRVRPALQLEAV